MSGEERQPTAEEARALLERDRRDRVARCQAAIQAALAEHRCRLDVFVVLRRDQVAPQVRVVAEED